MHKQTSLKLIRDQSNPQNTLLKLQKYDQKQGKVFISKQQRFITKPNQQLPGPGTYIDPFQKSRILQKERQQNFVKRQPGNHLDNIVSRQHQWIFGSNRLAYSNNGSGLGPGAYNLTENHIKKAVDSWGKAQRFNGTQWGQSQSSLGPGSYESRQVNIKPRKRQMSIFKSKAPKTFIDQIERSIEKNQGKKQKSFQPSNEQIEELQKLARDHQKQTKKKKMDSVFVSKSKRYELINPQNGIAAPGSYNLNNLSIIKHKRKKTNSFSTSTNYIRQKPPANEEMYIGPGPASYHIQKFDLQKVVKEKITSLKGNMALQTRFKNDFKKNAEASTLPGPGHYSRQKYLFVNEKQYEHKPLVNHHERIEVPFLSSSSRVIEEQVPSPFGGYNLNQFDLGEKARKKRSHLQKLKAMDIQVPGFGTQQRRTTFNLGKIMKQHFNKIQNSQFSAQRVKSNISINKD